MPEQQRDFGLEPFVGSICDEREANTVEPTVGSILIVKSESLPDRCEICHQSDCFDRVTNHCSRCASAQSSEVVKEDQVDVIKSMTEYQQKARAHIEQMRQEQDRCQLEAQIHDAEPRFARSFVRFAAKHINLEQPYEKLAELNVHELLGLKEELIPVIEAELKERKRRFRNPQDMTQFDIAMTVMALDFILLLGVINAWHLSAVNGGIVLVLLLPMLICGLYLWFKMNRIHQCRCFLADCKLFARKSPDYFPYGAVKRRFRELNVGYKEQGSYSGPGDGNPGGV